MGNSLIDAQGLKTFENSLGGNLPPGSLLEANNIVIDRPGIITPRRGLGDYGDAFPNTLDRAKQLLVYKGRILRHYFDNDSDTNILQVDSDGEGAFTNLGEFNETEAGLRIKGIEANGNFYFTTNEGIKKISATSASQLDGIDVTDAGGVNALDLLTTINYTVSGFLSPLSKVAYRTTWLIRDANSNTIEGSPSERSIVTNFDTVNSAVVDLQFTVPERITTDYFYRIYRTAVSTTTAPLLNDLDPGDEMNLVFEAQVTAAQIAAGMVQETDITPEDFRISGTPLYTNPNTGEGIEQANDVPPLAKDIASFRASTFYANTQTKHRKFFNLLTVSGFVSGTSQIVIANGLVANTYTFRGDEKISKVTTVADVTDSLNGKYFLLSGPNNQVKYYVWFKTSGGVLTDPAIAGRLGIQINIATNAADTVVASAINTALNLTDDFSSTVSTATVTISNTSNGYADDTQDGTSGFTFDNTGAGTQPGRGETLTGTISGVSVASPTVITSTNHKLFDGDQITISGTNTTPSINGTHTITRVVGVNGTNQFTIPVNVTTVTTGTGSWTEASNYVLLSNLPTVGQQVDETARSLVRIINQNDNETVYARYLSGPGDIPGEILLESRTNEDITYFLGASSTGVGDNFNPTFPPYHTITNITEANPTVITSAAHGLVSNDDIVIYGSDSTPTIDGVRTVTVINANDFSIPVNVTSDGTDIGFWFLATEASNNEGVLNRLYYSKYQQPEAVPLVNFQDIGAKDKAIKRIIALRDSLFILKEDGVYRLSGNSPSDFQIALFDGNCNITAADSADTMNNQIFMLADDGIAMINDTGISNMSRDIENLIYDATTFAHTFYKTATFGMGYDNDHSYLIWLTTDDSDEVATQCFRYNIFTNTWTKFDLTATCAVVNEDLKMYMGLGDRDVIVRERKTRTRRDYADRELFRSIGANSVNGNEVMISSIADVDVGDVLSQIQYLSISDLNILLQQLDNDPLVNDPTYFTDLGAISGSNLRDLVDALAAKLDTEPGLDGNYAASITGTNTFIATQSDFNIIVNKLNLDAGVFFTNYDISVGTKFYEMPITLVDSDTNTVTLQYGLPYVEGDVSVFKGITTTIVWAPQHFGDPSILKQVMDGTLLFEKNIFSTGVVSYSSDLSTLFDDIAFTFPGAGIWGSFLWGNQTWGGEGSGIPLRTLIPLQKQRCRYLNVKFEHVNAFEQYALLGISLTPRALSDRGYR